MQLSGINTPLSILSLTLLSLLNPSNAVAEQHAVSEDHDLEVITVKSQRGLISYMSASGAKSDVPIIETPLSVSVLTQERIEDLGALTIQDAIGYVSGLYNGPYGVDTRGDWSVIRGVSPVQYLDGLKSLYGSYNNVRTNPYGLSQIEILKGPSSVLYGQGSIGGIVNLVSKKPEAETSGQLWGQVGNYSRKQVAGDITGALNDDASLQGRVIGLWRESDTQTDYVPDNSIVFSPSLTWYATDDTKITLLTNWQKNESGTSTSFLPHSGTILENENGKIPSNRFVSEPGFDRYDTEQASITAILEQNINADWQFKLAARYTDSHAEYHTIYGWPPKFSEDGRSVKRVSYLSSADSRAIASDAQFHGNIITGNIEHTIVMGLDYQNAYTDNDSVSGLAGTLDLFSPVYGKVDNLPTVGDLIDVPSSKTYQTGLYIQDSMKIADKWIVSTALRRDKATTNPENGKSESQYATTGRLGLMYLFDSGVSPYASYSESFEPLIGQDAYGKAFEPKTGEQVEAGLKYQPAGTEHLLTAAVYHIVEQNRTTSLPADQVGNANLIDPNGQVQQGEVTVKGIELEAQLAWDTVDVYASYAYTDGYVSQSNTLGEDGAKLSALPDQQASIWSTWRPESLNGFKMGFGARYVGETSDGSAYVEMNNIVLNDPIKTDNYTLFDAMIGYDFDDYSFSLQAQNLTDKTVITSCLARGDCFYGQRRTVTANVRYKF
ncbi:TonB-dependent siderophore receptor [Pseudoalteromonas sp. SR44-8]|uniref:TonB-dependent siderophore receptor n=1 Tax=Pseudoalteromonas sp. SR44-8 TaxID=2760933 RepID=UPI0015FFEE2F|nr:TonB-dependent siderophore receptor [Pseudoalteromonas sp. SR44-8]MBB1302249.1 TonB-dependent siderophore receptor [Pseudoalteromonas sp. SR44-8]